MGCCASCEKAEMRTVARRYLERLGKLSHPHAESDPVGALGQVAVDLQQALLLARGGTLTFVLPPDRTHPVIEQKEESHVE